MRCEQTDGTRKLILETAKTLLRRFGEDKLTVVDIARSLDMSHANVYRFFKTKSEILDGIVEEWLVKLEAFMEAVAARRIPAAQRLEAVVIELHRKRKQKLLKDSEVFETYRRMIEARPEVAAERRKKVLNIFRRLIEEGIKNGEFSSVDSREAATVLKDATMTFLHPLLIHTHLDADSETRARTLVRFILAGFSRNGAKKKLVRSRGKITGKSRSELKPA